MTDYKTAADVLTEATRLVGGDRGKTHGSKHDNFTKIARIWNAYLRNANPAHIALTPSQAADLMELMKVARRQSGSFNPDDYIDGAGYAGVAFEAHVEEDRLMESVVAAQEYGAAIQPLGSQQMSAADVIALLVYEWSASVPGTVTASEGDRLNHLLVNLLGKIEQAGAELPSVAVTVDGKWVQFGKRTAADIRAEVNEAFFGDPPRR